MSKISLTKILPWDGYQPHILVCFGLFLLNLDFAQVVGLSYDVGPGGVDVPVQGPRHGNHLGGVTS